MEIVSCNSQYEIFVLLNNVYASLHGTRTLRLYNCVQLLDVYYTMFHLRLILIRRIVMRHWSGNLVNKPDSKFYFNCVFLTINWQITAYWWMLNLFNNNSQPILTCSALLYGIHCMSSTPLVSWTYILEKCILMSLQLLVMLACAIAKIALPFYRLGNQVLL